MFHEFSTLLSLGVGVAFVVVNHYLAGCFGELELPAAFKGALRSDPKLMAPVIDSLLFTLPTIGLFAALSGLFFWLLRPVRKSHLLIVAIAWFVPSLALHVWPWSGEAAAWAGTPELMKKWPHIFVLTFAPLIGFAAGYASVRKRSNRAEQT